MKTLHLYLTRQVAASLLLTVAVFTFVLLLGNLLKEILMLLVGGQVGVSTVLKAVALLVPFVLVYALPMGMLTATLLVFGRFSADQELTAARASGLSLLSLITPILLLSLALCGVCAWVNLELGPRSRVAYKDLLTRMRVQMAGSILQEGRFVKDIPNCIIYVGKNDGRNLTDVKVYWLENGTNITLWMRAPRGAYEFNPTNGHLALQLFDSTSVALMGGQWHPGGTGEWTYETNVTLAANSPESISISDMTFGQLRQELRNLERRLNFAPPSPRMSPEQLREQLRLVRQQKEDLALPVLVQMHWRVSFAFACFGFTLVGIPLGIRLHRRETNVGVAIALGLVLVYYSFILMGQSLAARPEWMPQIIVWLPNFLFQIVGAVLLWRANKGI